MVTSAAYGPPPRAVVKVVVIAAATLLVLYGLYLIRHVLILVVVAAFLAVGLDPAVRKLERLGLGRGSAITVIFVAAIGLLTAFALAVIPPLVEQISRFATNLPEYIQNFAERNPRVEAWAVENDVPQRLERAVSDIPTLIGGSFGNVLGLAGSVLAALFNVLTVVILTIYFLASLSRIREDSLRLVPRSRRERVSSLLDPILEKIGGYIAGQLTVALTAGVLSFIFLAVVGVPFPVALALWVSIAALIPLVGATLGAIPSAIVAFFTSLPLGIATVAFFVVYQQVENYVIAPRIMTRAVDISPAAVLLAALIGGSLLGFFGALMAIPAAASLKLVVQEVVIPELDSV